LTRFDVRHRGEDEGDPARSKYVPGPDIVTGEPLLQDSTRVAAVTPPMKAGASAVDNDDAPVPVAVAENSAKASMAAATRVAVLSTVAGTPAFVAKLIVNVGAV